MSVQTLTDASDIQGLESNMVVGEPKLCNSRIVFKGENNLLYCEDGVVLQDTSITFNGSNGLAVLGSSKNPYYVDLTINNDCSVVIGRDVYFNGALRAIVSEQCTIAIGDGCLLSFGIWMRTADPHLVYDAKTHRRLNYSRDIIIGDHVWIGQDAFVLKGTTVGSGSIVGARTVVAGKTIPSNTSWSGNPARLIREGVFWEGSCVHMWTRAKTRKSETLRTKDYLYRDSSRSVVESFVADPELPSQQRLEHYLANGFGNGSHDRLAVGPGERHDGSTRGKGSIRQGIAGLARRMGSSR
ncbi:MAG: acyltransferase [Atopobiaceae bacterium]|nr:acyltransferase [Atopobiaceae bacterium]